MNKIEIRQIYYDDTSFSQLQEPFIPLNNVEGDKSWFEFWPMINFLAQTELEENIFYGFFSPKFSIKTGFSPESAMAVINKNSEKDVVIFSYAWDQLCYFINPWEQGELWQQGITKATQDFLDYVGFNVQISQLITSRKNSVFSNFIVAKKSYWEKWKALASQFLLYADDPDGDLFHLKTQYLKSAQPMKVFIQERLPALLLADKSLSVAAIDVTTGTTAPFFVNSPENKKRLEHCDWVKDKIIETGMSRQLINEFNNSRKNVLFKK